MIGKIAASGICIEINTAGLRVPAKEIYPNIEFLKLCYHYKVPVSLGSDAHKPNQVGENFQQAVRLLKEVGYDKVVTFTHRNRNYHRI